MKRFLDRGSTSFVATHPQASMTIAKKKVAEVAVHTAAST
jgi:hypothetical protein